MSLYDGNFLQKVPIELPSKNFIKIQTHHFGEIHDDVSNFFVGRRLAPAAPLPSRRGRRPDDTLYACFLFGLSRCQPLPVEAPAPTDTDIRIGG